MNGSAPLIIEGNSPDFCSIDLEQIKIQSIHYNNTTKI